MGKTELKYLTQPDLFEGDATVLSSEEDEKGLFLITDSTLFYPQGGGQPSDRGQFFFKGKTIPVVLVRFDEGRVKHYVQTETPVLSNGDKISMQVEKEFRITNSKIHTAGHLLDNVIEQMEGVNLRGVKGFHFPQGSYVEFIGDKPEDVSSFLEELNHGITKAIEENHSVKDRLVDYQTLSQMEISIPDNLPKDKPLRVVTVGHFTPIPCGGTHVDCLQQLGSATAHKLKSKNGRIKISYRIG